MDTEKTAEFLDLYAKLEGAIRERYNVPNSVGAISWLAANDQASRRLRDGLDYCREVRNFLQHNERIDHEYAVIPSDSMLELMRSTLAYVEGMSVARDICVRTANICSATMEDRVLPVIKAMAQNTYTHVPILKDRRVVGVFSQGVLLRYLAQNEVVGFSEDDRFASIADLLPLDRHGSETFAFVAEDAMASDIVALFQKALRRSKRIGMIFVTAHGKQSERLIGILNAHDLATFF